MCLVFFDTMEKKTILIRFLFLDGKTCKEIKAKLDAVYGDPSSSATTVRYWFNEFNAVVHPFLIRNAQAAQQT